MQVTALDYIASGYGTPKQDDINDWTVVASGSTNNVGVWCELSRPLKTCDPSEDFQLYDTGASVSGLLAFGAETRTRPVTGCKASAHSNFHARAVARA